MGDPIALFKLLVPQGVAACKTSKSALLIKEKQLHKAWKDIYGAKLWKARLWLWMLFFHLADEGGSWGNIEYQVTHVAGDTYQVIIVEHIDTKL